jgi:hypothetical protein
MDRPLRTTITAPEIDEWMRRARQPLGEPSFIPEYPREFKAMSASKQPTGWKRWLWPLRSRKVQVALVTIVVAWAGHFGLELNVETLAAVVATGVSVIFGIAIEDAGEKAGQAKER